MKATIKEAEENYRNLTVEIESYGHWKISMNYRGKRLSTTTTDSKAVDNFKSDFDQRNNQKGSLRKQGYQHLCEEIIDKNK